MTNIVITQGQCFCAPDQLDQTELQNETRRNNSSGLIEFGAKLKIFNSYDRDSIMKKQ